MSDPRQLPGTDYGPNGVGMPPSSATDLPAGKRGKGSKATMPLPPVPPPYEAQLYGALPLAQCTTRAQRNAEAAAFRQYLAQHHIKPPLDKRGRMLPRSRWYLTQTGQVVLGTPPPTADAHVEPTLEPRPRPPLEEHPYVPVQPWGPESGLPPATADYLNELQRRFHNERQNDFAHVLDHVEMERQVQVVVKLIGRGCTQHEIKQYAIANWRTGWTDKALAHTMAQAKAIIRSNWAVDREQFLCDLLEQYQSLHAEARRAGNLAVALGVLNSVARLTMLGGFNPRAVAGGA